MMHISDSVRNTIYNSSPDIVKNYCNNVYDNYCNNNDNDKQGNFKSSHTLEERKAMIDRFMVKYEGFIPVILEKQHNSKIKRTNDGRFAVRKGSKMMTFAAMVKSKYKIRPEESIFYFIDNMMLSMESSIDALYEQYKSEDGILYITCVEQETFG